MFSKLKKWNEIWKFFLERYQFPADTNNTFRLVLEFEQTYVGKLDNAAISN
jgi:hypothetical protein